MRKRCCTRPKEIGATRQQTEGVIVESAPPLGIKLLAAFFAFGAGMSLLTIFLLLFPGSALDALWRLNPDAYIAFQSLGKLSILVMIIVGGACAFAAIGLAKNQRWGHNLALIILVVNLTGDLINTFARHDWRTVIGLPISGVLIFYLWAARKRGAENG